MNLKGTSPLRARKQPLLVLLHGVGGKEEDLFMLSDQLDERLVVISVQAPYAQSPTSYAWYRISPFAGDRSINAEDAEHSRQVMIKFIQEAVVAYEIDPAQVYLLGYDQGATIALSITLTEPGLIAGLVAISGQILPDVRHMVTNLAGLKGKPAFLLYGLHDQVVTVQTGRQTRDLLSQMMVDVSYREYPLGHYLSSTNTKDAATWLTTHLNTNKKVWAFDDKPSIHIGHVQLRVRDLERAILFYQRFLGLRLAERTGKAFAFLSAGYMHHEIALQNVGPDALDVPPKSVGLVNVAFETLDLVTFARAYKNLVDAGIKVRTADHFISWSMYFEDPDGNGIEIYCDTRDMPGRSDHWQGRDLPLEAEKILAMLNPEELAPNPGAD